MRLATAPRHRHDRRLSPGRGEVLLRGAEEPLRAGQAEDLADGLVHAGHEGPGQAGERPLDEAAVVDGAELIDEEIRRPAQALGRGDADAEGLGVVEEGGG